jgi:hypothetical protein
MFKFLKKWFGKKEKPLFDKRFLELADKVVSRPSNKPFDPKLLANIVSPTDPLDFVSTLDFSTNADLSVYNLSELSNEAKLKIIDIIKEDNKNRIKAKL